MSTIQRYNQSLNRIDKNENLYYYNFICPITNSGTASALTVPGLLDPEFDSEFGLYKLTIHLLNYNSEDVRKYFYDLYSNKYGKCDSLIEYMHGTHHYYNVWSNKKRA